jgi:hypothetical protein
MTSERQAYKDGVVAAAAVIKGKRVPAHILEQLLKDRSKRYERLSRRAYATADSRTGMRRGPKGLPNFR